MRTWAEVWDNGGGRGEREYRDRAAVNQTNCSGGLLPTDYAPPAGAANLGNPTPFLSLELVWSRKEEGPEPSEPGPLCNTHRRARARLAFWIPMQVNL